MVFRNVRIIINTNDHEPPHLHVIRGEAEAKIETLTHKVLYHVGFTKNDIRRLVEFITEQSDLLMEAWNEIHKKGQKK